MRSVKHWPIGVRVTIGTAIPLLAALFIGLKGMAALQWIGKDLARTADAIRVSMDAARAQSAYLELKVTIREYIARNSEQRRQRAEQAYRAALAAAANAEDRSAIEAYWAGFREIVDLRTEQNRLRDDAIRQGGSAMRLALEGPLSSWPQAKEAFRPLMLMRVYAERYLDGGAAADLERARREGERLAGLAADAPGEAGEQFRARLAAFRQALTRWAELAARLVEIDRSVLEERGNALMARLSEREREQTALAESAKAETAALVSSSIWTTVIALLIGALLAALCAAAAVLSVTRPLKAGTGAMRSVAEGNLDVDIPGTDRKDELGDLARALEVFRQNARERRRLEAEAEAGRIAAKRRQEEIDQLTGLFGKSIGGVFSRVSEACGMMRHTADGMVQEAAATAQGAREIGLSAEQTLASIQTVSAAAEELATSVREIAAQAARAANTAKAGAEEATSANTAARELSQAADRVSGILRMISEVAERTNLLALNATIEAARAGEAGKGFAVVASEVKTLANQTAKATDEISAQIEAMRRVVGETVAVVGQLGQRISEMTDSAAAVAAAVEQQGAATQEIAKTTEQVVSAMVRVNSATRALQDAAANTDGGARDVAIKAGSLTKETDVVAREVTEFLSALGQTKSGERFRRHDTDLPADVTIQGVTTRTRVRVLTGGSAFISSALSLRPCDAVTISIEGFSRPIQARFAGQDEGGCWLQFPMDLDHVDWVESEIVRVGLKKAA